MTLEGEALFEVARNEARPFIVQSGKQRVEVLGTSFDVTAYEGEPGIYTTLLQGSVEVSGEKGKQLLKPRTTGDIHRKGNRGERSECRPLLFLDTRPFCVCQ